ncbi:MAG: hypothetical protein ACRC5T_14060 [Cetobacterium sp.]
MFKVGDKVYDVRHGWGVVERVEYCNDFPILVVFEKYFDMYTVDGKSASFNTNTCLFFEKIKIPVSALARKSWRAEPNERYYSVDTSGEIIEWDDDYDSFDDKQHRIGNYFRDIEEAKISKFYKMFNIEDK